MVRDNGKAIGDLKKAIRDVRMALADREDVVVDLREAEQTRLALLSEALYGVFDGLPAHEEQFSLAVLPGNPPRFWVDATSFVVMARDKRTYQFVKDTRLGRTILAESTSQETIADAVTRYVAERLVEREQVLEADWVTAMLRTQRAGPGRGGFLNGSKGEAAWLLAGFGLGMLAGIVLLLVTAWIMVG